MATVWYCGILRKHTLCICIHYGPARSICEGPRGRTRQPLARASSGRPGESRVPCNRLEPPPLVPLCCGGVSRGRRLYPMGQALSTRGSLTSSPRTPSAACEAQLTRNNSYLVDPASSHMLVSKTKPCMSKYTPSHGETANGSLNQLWFLRSYNPTWITVAILELIHATKLRPREGKERFC